MALCANLIKACRLFHFFRHGCFVEPKEFGKPFYQGRGRGFCPESSPCSYFGKRGTSWFEYSYDSLCKFTLTCRPIGRSMLDGPPRNIHRHDLVPALATRSQGGEVSEGTSKSWPWCWFGALGTLCSPSADLMDGGSFRIKKSALSTLASRILSRQASAAKDGHLHTFGGPVQSEDSIAPLNRVPREPELEGSRTSQVQSRLMCRDHIVSLDAVDGAARQRKSRMKTRNGGAKARTRLTPGYFIQLLQHQKDPNVALCLFKWAERQSGYKHTLGTYCALIKALSSSKSFSALRQVKKEIEFKGLPSSTNLLKTLAFTFSQGGLADETIECLERMEDLGWRPRLLLYNDLIHSLVKADCPDGAHLLYRRMLDVGCRPDSCTFNNLLAGKSSSLVNMQRILEEMKQQSCKPTAVTIAILLNVLCKGGKLDEAWSLFVANKDLANVVVSNTMLHGLCKVGRIDQALKLFQQMKEKKLRLQTATFNILIHGLGLASRTKDAVQLFQSMVDWEVPPDVLTYNVTLKILIKDGRLHEACRIFEEMATKLLTPDIITYGTLIDGFCKKGDFDSACTLFMTMQGSCSEADTVGCIRAHCKAREVDDGVFRSRGSRSTGFRFDKVVYTALCTHLFKAGRVDEAHELFREIAKADPGLFLFAYNAAIHGVGKAGDIDNAWKLFQSMSVHGCKPDVVTYNTLISSFGKSNQVDRACDLFLEMQVLGFKPDVVTCTTLVDALCKSGRMQWALDLFKEMQGQGISPNVLTYHSLFDGLRKEGQLNRAYLLYEEMMNKHCVLNEVMYRSLIRGFSNTSHLVNLSYRLYIEMSEKGYPSDSLTSHMLMRSLRRAGKTVEALDVVSRSSRKGKF